MHPKQVDGFTSQHMAKRTYPLAKMYGPLETGPVVLITTAHKGEVDIMTESWHTMARRPGCRRERNRPCR